MSPQAALLEAIAKRDHLQAELDAAALEVSMKLVSLRYQGTPAAELAATLGISRQRIYQVLERAERDMRREYEESAEKEAVMRLSARRGGKRSGWQGGRTQPRCGSCEQFIATPTSRCSACGHWGEGRYAA